MIKIRLRKNQFFAKEMNAARFLPHEKPKIKSYEGKQLFCTRECNWQVRKKEVE